MMSSSIRDNNDAHDDQADLLQQQGYTPLYVSREDSNMASSDLEFGSFNQHSSSYDQLPTITGSRNEAIPNQEQRLRDMKAFLSRIMRISKCTCVILVLIVSTMFVGIMFGAFIEQRSISQSPTTFAFYNSSRVCATGNDIGIDDFLDADQQVLVRKDTMKTFNSSEEAHQHEFEVVHCGDCGQCSTWNDMRILADTKTTLTKRSKLCAARGFFGGKKAIAKCVHDTIGFTTPCQDCWVNDMMCTFSNCVYTCLKSIYILGERKNVKNGGLKLNSCLECDERMCGPAFLDCAGVNRRRLGIESDIHRNFSLEQCHSVDIHW